MRPHFLPGTGGGNGGAGSDAAPRGRATPAETDILEQHRDVLESLAYSKIGDWEAAADLTQEAFLRVLRKWDAIRDPSHVPVYLKRTVGNLCKNYLRDRKPEVPLAVPTDDTGDAPNAAAILTASAEEIYLERESHERLLKAVKTLRPMHRRVLFMRLWDGLRYHEIGRILGIGREAVKKRLQTARRHLVNAMSFGAPLAGGPVLRCEQCRDLLAPFIEGHLAFPAVRSIHWHLHFCARCTAELERVCWTLRQVDVALGGETWDERMGQESTPAVWARAWRRIVRRGDDIAQSDPATRGVVSAFARPTWEIDAERLDPLLALVRRRVQASPGSPMAHGALGIVHLRRGDFCAAEHWFQEQRRASIAAPAGVRDGRMLAESLDNLRWVHELRAAKARKAGDEDGAVLADERMRHYTVRCLQHTGAWGPEESAYAKLSQLRLLCSDGRASDALHEGQRWTRKLAASGARTHWHMIVPALMALGRVDEAARCQAQVISAAPLDARGLQGLWNCHEQAGNVEETAFWRAREQALRKHVGPVTGRV